MSVILFTKESVYQDLANAYEGVKWLIHANEEMDMRFYKSLRRLYFANVATFLCQYHNELGLPQEELIGIDTFSALQGKADPMKSNIEKAHDFLSNWGLLEYNLTTNDGEQYHPTDAYAFVRMLAFRISREVLERAVHLEEKH